MKYQTSLLFRSSLKSCHLKDLSTLVTFSEIIKQLRHKWIYLQEPFKSLANLDRFTQTFLCIKQFSLVSLLMPNKNLDHLSNRQSLEFEWLLLSCIKAHDYNKNRWNSLKERQFNVSQFLWYYSIRLHQLQTAAEILKLKRG